MPYIVVVGEKERSEKVVVPRVRIPELGKENTAFTMQQLHELIVSQTKEFPQQKLPVNLYVSKRPKFKG